MSETNLTIWKAFETTPKEHTKPFERAGGFKGTATKPIYWIKRMTEQFGPCGQGWGMTKPEFTLQPVGDEILVYCVVGVWIEPKDAQIAAQSDPIYGVGGDKVVVKRRNGRIDTDDEAFKKAYTDALGNAVKHLGMSADIHFGHFDGSKYVSEEESAGEKVTTPAQPKFPDTDVVIANWTKATVAAFDECATSEALQALWQHPEMQKKYELAKQLDNASAKFVNTAVRNRAARLKGATPAEAMP